MPKKNNWSKTLKKAENEILFSAFFVASVEAGVSNLSAIPIDETAIT